MPEWLQVLLSAVAGIALVWMLLIVLLWLEQRRHPDRTSLRDLLRLAPDVVRLIKRLVTASDVPLRVRVWLGVLLVYLLSPIDLVPDFIPVLGYADDALIVALALRYAFHHAGEDVLADLWPGTRTGLNAVLRLSGLRPTADRSPGAVLIGGAQEPSVNRGRFVPRGRRG